jgi:hypothetical protein
MLEKVLQNSDNIIIRKISEFLKPFAKWNCQTVLEITGTYGTSEDTEKHSVSSKKTDKKGESPRRCSG